MISDLMFYHSIFGQNRSAASTEGVPLVSMNILPKEAIVPEKRRPTWRQGHHFGLRCCVLAVIIVLLINVISTIAIKLTAGTVDGIAKVVQGDCAATHRLSTGLAVLINAFATILLGASNYCMQCVAAPTRADIDKAHQQREWMDIGIPSIRNLKRISWPRKAIWCLLFISSLPLHLTYNSVIFESVSTYYYDTYLVTQDFLDSEVPVANETFRRLTADSKPVSVLSHLRATQRSLTEISARECQKSMNQAVVPDWKNIVVVSSYKNDNVPILAFTQISEGDEAWSDSQSLITCGAEAQGRCGDRNETAARDGCFWKRAFGYATSRDPELPNCFPITHCLLEEAAEHCSLRFSVPIMVVVIICNIIKLICILALIWKNDSSPLVTLGDAVSSFLDSPDPTTIDNCLAGKSQFAKSAGWIGLPSPYRPKRHRWSASASAKRWWATIASCIILLAVAIVLLVVGNTADGGFRRSFGAIDAHNIIEFHDRLPNIIGLVLLTNTPQLLLSIIYFAYNSLYTCMLLSKEWSEFAAKPTALRVTAPTGRQRSTYRLNLPYRYGIPLLAASALLHWLVSQAFFVVVLDGYHNDNDVEGHEAIRSAGYSPSALLTTIVIGFAVPVIAIANGFRQYEVGIPLAGSCSAAISAACHPPVGDDRPSGKPVQWGSCGHVDRFSKVEDEPEVGHCSITSLTAERPIEGSLYAGVPRR